MAVTPSDMKIENRFPLQNFHNVPFVALPDSFDDEVQEVFKAHGVAPDINFTATDDYTIISMVEQGLGISVLPEMVLQNYRHCHIQTAPLEPSCKRQLGIVLSVGKEISPAAKRFIECARNVSI